MRGTHGPVPFGDRLSATDIMRALINYPAGFTFDLAHGATRSPGFGYIVGGTVPGLTYKVEEPDADPARVRQEVWQWLSDTDGVSRYVGGWAHEGVVYFDRCDLVSDRAEAVELAQKRGELAIWDCAAQDEIATVPILSGRL